MSSDVSPYSSFVTQTHEISGPLIVATFLCMLLLGVFWVQLQTFFYKGRRDSKWITAFVVAEAVFMPLLTALIAWVGWKHSMQAIERPYSINEISPECSVAMAFVVILTVPVQLFFAWRVRLLTERIWLFFIILAAILAELGLGLYFAGVSLHLQKFNRFIQIRTPVMAWSLLVVAVDAVIAINLVQYLRAHRTGFASTDDMLKRIIRLTIHTNLATTITHILGAVLFAAMPYNLYALTVSLPIPLLYAISLMSFLNARNDWGESKSKNARPVTPITGRRPSSDKKFFDSWPLSSVLSSGATSDTVQVSHVIDISSEVGHGTKAGHKKGHQKGNSLSASDTLAVQSHQQQSSADSEETKRDLEMGFGPLDQMQSVSTRGGEMDEKHGVAKPPQIWVQTID